jgi:hypothetical protein
MLRRINSPYVLVVVVALVVLGVGAGLALAHGGDATAIHGCLGGEGKAVRIIAAPGIGDPNATCKASETAVDWSQTGPPGAAGPTSLHQEGGTTVIGGGSTILSHTVTADEAGLTIGFATLHFFDRDSVAGGGTTVTCGLGGFHGDATGDVVYLQDSGEPGILHRDRQTVTLMGRAVLEEGDSIVVSCSAFAGDDDEAAGFGELLLEHVSS